MDVIKAVDRYRIIYTCVVENEGFSDEVHFFPPPDSLTDSHAPEAWPTSLNHLTFFLKKVHGMELREKYISDYFVKPL